MITIVVQIGNSDDKLPQARWARFITRVHSVCADALTVHFSGGSAQDATWQNYCILGVAEEEFWVDHLRSDLSQLAAEFGQESIALTIGKTEFVKGGAS